MSTVAIGWAENALGPQWLLRYTRPAMRGEVITFYSYKGGTGRSMALANCAGLLAEAWPESAKPILLIDFDLEAPGLHQYLQQYLPPPDSLQDQAGTLELFTALYSAVEQALAARGGDASAKEGARLDEASCQALLAQFDFSPYLIESTLNKVWLIKAGRPDASYSERLGNMNWKKLHALAPGIFRALAAWFAEHFACTLIDARTGLSDTSSICTMLLPDVLTVVFTLNRQSLTGIEHLVREAKKYRDTSADLRPLRFYPLASRVDNASDINRQIWREGCTTSHTVFGEVSGYEPMFTRLFGEIFDQDSTGPELAAGMKRYFDMVQVPHNADYAFGERLCFGSQASADRFSLRATYESFLQWLASGAEPWQSPRECLDLLQVEDWLTSLAPPELGDNQTDDKQTDDNATAFASWLEQIGQLGQESATPGYALVRDVLLAWGKSNQPVTAAMAALLPAAMLAQAICWMEASQWVQAADLFQRSSDNSAEFGLAVAWGSVPQRWLQHHSDKRNFSLLAGWSASPCCDAMLAWIEAAQLDRAQNWAWQDQVLCVWDIVQSADKRRKPMAERMLEQRSAVLGAQHPDSLQSKAALADALADLGDYAGARQLQEPTLELQRKILGEAHSDTLNSMASLSHILFLQGDLEQANAITQSYLAVSQKVMGPQHPDTLMALSNLAAILNDQGDLYAARSLAEQALAGRKQVYGEEDQRTLHSMVILANIMGKMGEMSTAQGLLENVLAVRTRILGKEHLSTLSTMAQLANIYSALGNIASARAFAETILEQRRRLLGGEHPDTLGAMNNLGRTLLQQGELGSAEKLLSEAVAIYRQVLGEEHPDTLACMGNWAVALRDIGAIDKAFELEQQVLAAFQSQGGPDHPHTLLAMHNLAITLARMRRLPEARALLEENLRIRHETQRDNDSDALQAKSNLAATLLLLGEQTAAVTMLRQVLDANINLLGASNLSTISSFSALMTAMRASAEEEGTYRLMKEYAETAEAMFAQLGPKSGQSSSRKI